MHIQYERDSSLEALKCSSLISTPIFAAQAESGPDRVSPRTVCWLRDGGVLRQLLILGVSKWITGGYSVLEQSPLGRYEGGRTLDIREALYIREGAAIWRTQRSTLTHSTLGERLS